MRQPFFYTIACSMFMVFSCENAPQKMNANTPDSTAHVEGSFGYDLQFLSRYDSVIVLQGEGLSRVLVSPKYQAKVFTSSADGEKGQSFGWVNYKAFSQPVNEHMNAYGGENRLWLGPEGGRFSLYFKPGAEMTFDNWKTPAAIDTEVWQVIGKSRDSVLMQKEMKLVNYQGTSLQLVVDRSVKILSSEEVMSKLGLVPDQGVKMVGYETENTLKNTGTGAWTESTGMPCIWILDMFKPTDKTVIIVPFKAAAGKPFEKIANAGYFGEIPADRLSHTDDILYFRADGKQRGKLGVLPEFVKPVAGSYDAEKNVLTVTMFTVAGGKYLNQEWNTSKPPFSGDAMNAYNDGPLADGSQMGPFYEIESVSPAAFLAPGESLSHRHAVFHFSGTETALDGIAQKLFGVRLDAVKSAFSRRR